MLDGHSGEHDKKGLVSLMANSAIRRHNLPDQGHYIVADYQSFRNIYRGPFNFMWESIKEGLLYIVPTGASGILLGDPEKKAEKAQEENQEKHRRKKERKKESS